MKVLFITHETSRSGAPFVLLFFLKWIKKNHPNIHLNVLSIKGGNIEKEFRDIADTYFSLEERSRSLSSRISSKIFGVELKDNKLKKIANHDFDVIYANTIVSIPIATQIAAFKSTTPVIAHIHELPTVIDILLPKLESISKKVRHFISVSQMSKDTLVNSYKIHPKNISICPEFTNLRLTREQKQMKKDLVIGGSGNIDWRKGADLFISVAINLKKFQSDINFTFNWIGRITKQEKIIFTSDIKKAGLEGAVKFLGEQEEPEHFYKDFDVFLLTSREDPFPLAAIELGMMGIPIICFESASGIAELVKNGGGHVVPYLDTVAMAEKILTYCENPTALKKDGEIARELFSIYTPENICPKIFNIIKKGELN